MTKRAYLRSSLIVCLALVVTAPRTSIAQCRTPSFSDPLTFAAGDGPIGVAVGVKDNLLAVANMNSRDVSIFGIPGFLPLGTFPTDATGFGGLAFGDFDGDGHLDLAVSNNSVVGGVSRLKGDGTGLFTPSDIISGIDGISLAVGDFNGDGRDDVAIANSDTVTIYPGGTFIDGGQRSLSSGRPYIAVGDFNGDGHLDVVVANPGNVNFKGNTVAVLLGDGTGQLGAPVPFTVGKGPMSLVVGKFNADDALDIAVLNFDDQSVSILLGDGAGGFLVQPPIADVFAFQIASGDFNGDGKLDLATSTGLVSLGDGDGGFGQFTMAVKVSEESLAVGDFDRDGKPDLAFGSEGSDSVRVVFNTCKATTFKDIRDLIDGLPDSAFRAVGQRSALLSILADTESASASGDTAEAVRKLQNLRRRVDGCPSAADSNDWIINCTAQTDFRALLDGLIASLGS